MKTYLEVLEACKTLGKAGADIKITENEIKVKLAGYDEKVEKDLLAAMRTLSSAEFEQYQFVAKCKEKRVTPKCEFVLDDGKTYFVLPNKEDVVNAEFKSFGEIYPGANYKFNMRCTCCDGIAALLNKEIAKIETAKKSAEAKKAEEAKQAAEKEAAEKKAKLLAEWGF